MILRLDLTVLELLLVSRASKNQMGKVYSPSNAVGFRQTGLVTDGEPHLEW